MHIVPLQSPVLSLPLHFYLFPIKTIKLIPQNLVYFVSLLESVGWITLPFSMWCVLVYAWKFWFQIFWVLLNLKNFNFNFEILRLCCKCLSSATRYHPSENGVATIEWLPKYCDATRHVLWSTDGEKLDQCFNPHDGRPPRKCENVCHAF